MYVVPARTEHPSELRAVQFYSVDDEDPHLARLAHSADKSQDK
jgi:hypothetical protein